MIISQKLQIIDQFLVSTIDQSMHFIIPKKNHKFHIIITFIIVRKTIASL